MMSPGRVRIIERDSLKMSVTRRGPYRQVCKRLPPRDVDISESDPPPLSLGHYLLRHDQDRTGIRRYILSPCRCNDELAQRIPARTAGKSRSGVRCSAPGFTGSFNTRQAESGMGFVLFIDVDQHRGERLCRRGVVDESRMEASHPHGFDEIDHCLAGRLLITGD